MRIGRVKGAQAKTDWLKAQREAKAMGMGYIEMPSDIYLHAPSEVAPRRRYLRMGQSIHSTIVWALQALKIPQEHYFRAQALDLVEAVNDARVRSGLEPVALDFASLARKDRLRWATQEMGEAIAIRGKTGRKKLIAVHENTGTPIHLADPTPNGRKPGRRRKDAETPIEGDQQGDAPKPLKAEA